MSEDEFDKILLSHLEGKSLWYQGYWTGSDDDLIYGYWYRGQRHRTVGEIIHTLDEFHRVLGR